ncbi:MAG: hypothetical protein ABR572_05950 [Cryomorphaceae bacterium]|nr:hypothetical protein [Flavobacteriales bacterium]
MIKENLKNVKTKKGLVKKMRAIRDKINEDIQEMTPEEEIRYLEKMISKWKNSGS